jgi:hypothetical protein
VAAAFAAGIASGADGDWPSIAQEFVVKWNDAGLREAGKRTLATMEDV